jgi:hypothetical protein
VWSCHWCKERGPKGLFSFLLVACCQVEIKITTRSITSSATESVVVMGQGSDGDELRGGGKLLGPP